MDTDRGERLIEVSRPAIVNFLTDTPGYETDAPEDIDLEELWHHPDGYGYVLRVSSAEWDPLDEGEPIPQLDVTITENWED